MNGADSTRRDFLKTLGTGSVAAWSAACSAPHYLGGRNPGGRPNILIVMGDDHTCDHIGCYGSLDVRTPNMDRLAREGVRFTRCFTSTAMCAPTRQQLYTGLFPVRSGAYPNHSLVYEGTKSIVHYLEALGYRVGLTGKQHFGPPESFPFELIGDGSVDFEGAREFIHRDPGQPFCLFVCSHHPHAPWEDGEPGAYDPDRLSIPPYLVDTPELRRAMARYYGEVTALDHQLGRFMALLRRSGLEEDTLLIYTSEQGAEFPFGKWTCYDAGLRAAFIARWPGRIRPGTAASAMTQYVDVAPTLLEAAGGEPVPGLDGRSFLPVLLGRADRHRAYAYGVHTTRGIIDGTPCYPIRSVRSGTHKYIRNLNPEEPFANIVTVQDKAEYWNSWVERAANDPAAMERVHRFQHRPAEELYDIINDPHELDNLALEPGQRPLMDALGRELDAWMGQQGDLGVETEMRALERQKSQDDD